MKRILLALAFLLLLPSLASAETYTVCPDGDNSCDYTQSGFEVLSGTGYAGDIFYFKNTATFSPLDIHISGTSDSNRVTLDGLQEDNYDAYSEATGNVARIRNTGSGPVVNTYGRDYLTFQDFELDGDNDAVIAQTYVYSPRDGSSHMTFRRIFAHDALDGIQTLDGDYITIGGAPGDGIVVKDAGVDSGSEDISFMGTSNGVISYNHLYATRDYTNADARGIDGIILLYSDHILIEYNEIHSHNDRYGGDAMGEDGIDIKENNEYVIVRYNNIYDHNCDNANGCGSQHGIILHSGRKDGTGYQHHIYIYGNYIHDNDDDAILIWARGDTSGNYNDDLHDVYVWSNIFEGNLVNGLTLHESDLNADLYNVRIYNNVFEENSPNAQYSDNSAFTLVNCQSDIYIKNNIFYNNEAAYDNRQYWIDDGDTAHITAISYNNFFHPADGAGTPGYYGGSGLITTTVLNSQGNANNNMAVDPLFTGSDSHDFSLQPSSLMIGAGARITDTIGSITIQGKTHDLSFNTALHPSTDWNDVVKGEVYVTERSPSGSWDLGAYAYTGDDPQDTCESLGGSCCILPQTCPGTDIGTFTDCSGTCCSESCQAPSQDDTCLDRGFHCCDECVPDTEHPENDTDCPGVEVCCGECFSEPWERMEMEAESGTLSPPMIIGTDLQASEGTYIYSSNGNEGSVSFTFDVQKAANYRLEGMVMTPEPKAGHDSFFIVFDNQGSQGDDAYIWDTLQTDTFAWDNVSLRGVTGDYISAEFDPKIWELSPGAHIFKFFGREYDTRLDQVALVRHSHRADRSPWNGCIDEHELVPFIDLWKYDSTAYPMGEVMEAVSLWSYGTGCP